MKWLKKQWNENKEFRIAVVLLTSQVLVGAGAPAAIVKGVAAIVGAVSI
jgi:hypothetical protein